MPVLQAQAVFVLVRCLSFFTGKKEKNKGTEGSSTGELKAQLDEVQHPKILSENCDLKPATLDVPVPSGVQKNSRGNVRVMNLESPVKTEVEEAYEGEDEHEESPSIKRELSDFDLQVLEVAASKGGYDPSSEEIKYPSLYENQANIQLEDKDHEYSKKSCDIIQSGHVSDPGIGKAEFCASPKLKRSCSDLERRDVLRETCHLFPSSKSQSFEDLQGLSAHQMVNLESPRSVMTHRSADRVMLKRHSSSQVLPSRSKRLWWKLFLWSHRNIHRSQLSKSTQIHPVTAALNSQCGYSSDTLEPKQDKALSHVESHSPSSSFGEYFQKSCDDRNFDNQRWSRFQKDNFGFWPQNQWVAFSTESSSYSRVDEWVKDLEIQQPPLEDDFNDDNIGSIAFPPSPDDGRSMARSTAQLIQHPDANLSKEILNANSVVQSLNPASTAAHISSIGIKAIPSLSHFFSLRCVNLSNNLIVHITPGFLPKGIHTLNLSRNKISTIEGLRELTRLRVLDLSYNRISRIGQGLSNCTLVKELYLAGNKISDVEGLHRLLKLTVLDLSFNKIATTKALGQLVANYNSLQALNLLGNPIQSNISDDQLRKAVCGLLPKLVYLNKQSIKTQRGREILTDSVAKAALGNSSRTSYRRALKKGGGHGGSSSSSVHRSSASVSQKIRNRHSTHTLIPVSIQHSRYIQ
ncbi:Protein phosphatase 1 regulatory subunit pprA [Glycine max]|nr:Protein phosphatase 1 regulatory subunit pprA [Glycine max]